MQHNLHFNTTQITSTFCLKAPNSYTLHEPIYILICFPIIVIIAMLCILWHCNCTGVCDEPDSPMNGGKVTTGNTEGDTARYFCNSGFQLTGNTMRTCESDGQWSGSQPKCTRTFNGFGIIVIQLQTFAAQHFSQISHIWVQSLTRSYYKCIELTSCSIVLISWTTLIWCFELHRCYYPD